jgi:hypothetical protein
MTVSLSPIVADERTLIMRFAGVTVESTKVAVPICGLGYRVIRKGGTPPITCTVLIVLGTMVTFGPFRIDNGFGGGSVPLSLQLCMTIIIEKQATAAIKPTRRFTLIQNLQVLDYVHSESPYRGVPG